MSEPVVFLSARYARRHELRRYREDLQARGIRVAARWIDGEDEASLAGPDRADAFRLLEMVLIDLAQANVVVSFTEDPEHQPEGGSRGGRHVEFGMALEAGKRLYLVGPRENLFHHLLPDGCVLPTWEAALEEIDFAGAWGLLSPPAPRVARRVGRGEVRP